MRWKNPTSSHLPSPMISSHILPSHLIIKIGGGSVRFNPNLYASGKVCLSILGTWSGEMMVDDEMRDDEMVDFKMVDEMRYLI